MFGLGLATKIYVGVEGVDLRKGFDGLYGLVRDQLGHDPLSGHVFLFSNRTRDRARFRIPIGFRSCRVPLASPAREAIAFISKNRPRGNRSRSR